MAVSPILVCMFCAVYVVLRQCENLLTQQPVVCGSIALSDGAPDFLNGFCTTYQSIYVRMLKQITPKPLSILDHYPNV